MKAVLRTLVLILQKINDVGVLAPAPYYILTYKRSRHTGHSSQLVSTPIVTANNKTTLMMIPEKKILAVNIESPCAYPNESI